MASRTEIAYEVREWIVKEGQVTRDRLRLLQVKISRTAAECGMSYEELFDAARIDALKLCDDAVTALDETLKRVAA